MIQSNGLRRTILAISVISLVVSEGALAAGNISGHGRYEKIKGNPGMGYVELYETNLFISPGFCCPTGPSRRLGTTCNTSGTCNTSIITGDGCYCVDGLLGGSYSILMNQPQFYVVPKVIPNVTIVNGSTITVNPEMPIDFSTYFKNDWPGPDNVWYQTFTATGTSIRGVAFVLAGVGGTGSGTAEVAILKDNGNPDVRNWQLLGARFERHINSLADNWVRWRSGEIPTIAGVQYAVRITGRNDLYQGTLSMQPFKRDKDGSSYTGGQAYNGAGQAQSFDLNCTVFSDNDGTIVTMNNRELGLGDLLDGNFSTAWGQTFVAQGSSLAGVDVFAAGDNHQWNLDFQWKIRAGGPNGAQLGYTKITNAAFQSFGAGLHGTSFNRNEVPLVPGNTYFVEFAVSNPPFDSNGFNPYIMMLDSYDDGIGYRYENNGDWTPMPDQDVNMTILEYSVTGPIIGLNPTLITPTVWAGDNLPNGSFTIRNAGVSTLNYIAADNVSWIFLDPAGGTSTGESDPITVYYSVASLSVGQHTATITVTDPNAMNTPQTITVVVNVITVKPDFDGDRDVDMSDFAHFQQCMTGPGNAQNVSECLNARLDADEDVDLDDLAVLRNCFSGANVPAAHNCAG